MYIKMAIYKEKRRKNFRMIIVPIAKNEVGLPIEKDYAIVSYLDKNDVEKIGELVLWAFEESYEKVFKENNEIKYEKKYSNSSSYKKFTLEYNRLSFYFHENKYYLLLWNRDGRGYGPFEDENNEYEFGEKKPTACELGSKIMEMFEYKEKYDEL